MDPSIIFDWKNIALILSLFIIGFTIALLNNKRINWIKKQILRITDFVFLIYTCVCLVYIGSRIFESASAIQVEIYLGLILTFPAIFYFRSYVDELLFEDRKKEKCHKV